MHDRCLLPTLDPCGSTRFASCYSLFPSFAARSPSSAFGKINARPRLVIGPGNTGPTSVPDLRCPIGPLRSPGEPTSRAFYEGAIVDFRTRWSTSSTARTCKDDLDQLRILGYVDDPRFTDANCVNRVQGS